MQLSAERIQPRSARCKPVAPCHRAVNFVFTQRKGRTSGALAPALRVARQGRVPAVIEGHARTFVLEESEGEQPCRIDAHETRETGEERGQSCDQENARQPDDDPRGRSDLLSPR